MTPKEISRKSKRIFEKALPSTWAFRSQEDQEDYGIDGEIEIMDKSDHATGFIFKVQLKGEKNVSIINNAKKVSCNLFTARLNYYMNQIEIPVVLILVDIYTEKIYWLCLQMDYEIRENLKLALEKKQDNLTVHLDPNNIVIPEQIKKLFEHVAKNMDWLRLNALKRISSYASAFGTMPSLDEILEDTKLLQLHLYNDKFEKLFVAKEYEKLYNEAKIIMDSHSEKIETRFCACLYIEKVYKITIDRNSYDYFKIFEKLYLDLLNIIRNVETPNHIKAFVIFLIRNNRLYELVRKDYQFYVTDIHTKENVLLEGIINVDRVQVAFKTAKEIEKTVILIEKIHENKFHNILPEILVRFLPNIAIFARRMELENLAEEAKPLNNCIEFLTNLGINIALSIKNYRPVKAFIVYNIIADCSDIAIEKAKELIEKIDDENIRKETLYRINEIKKFKETNKLSPEEEIEIFKERAVTHGLDINNPKDEMGQIIAQGIKDYNPERVLKNCEHLLVFPDGPLGLPAQMIGLTTAGPKSVYCLKTKASISGWDLNGTYSFFRSENCKNCKYKKERPNEWKWDSQWQHKTMNEYKDIIFKK